MSKELEALQELRDLVECLTRIDYVPTALRNEVKELLTKHYEDSNGLFSQIEKALNELEDAKHNYRAIKEMYNNSVAYSTKIQEELNELKKRNEPKVLINDETLGPLVLHCPSCKAFVGFDKSVIKNYCPDCGQKLDLE